MDGINIPTGDMPVAANPWERFAWTPVQQGRIFRDWGVYLFQNDQNSIAEKCYDNCLEINPRDSMALLMRSLCKRSVANTKSALDDALAAAKINDFNPAISFAVCNALHELNEFESCKAELHNNTRKFNNAVVKNFLNHIIVIDQNLYDCLGDSLGFFMLDISKNRKLDKMIANFMKGGEVVNEHRRWKILRELNLCDVLSIPEIEEEILSPLELARRERWLKVYNQVYFGRNWVDVDFMRTIINTPDSISTVSETSKPLLSKLTEPYYEIVKKLVKMLHARSPLYNERRNKFKDEKLFKRHKANYLYIKQYQTRRNMHGVLRTIKEYRKKGYIEKMSNYIEGFMGDYVVLKTDRMMPWKFEFVNEVYNTLALAHSDQYSFSDKAHSQYVSRMSLRKFLKLNYEAADNQTAVEFGNREAYSSGELNATKEAKHQKLLARLEKRKLFADYSIERCYLWHEIARVNFKLARFDMCCSAARKAIEETKNCNSKLWEFLSMMLIVKAYASLRKVEYCQKALEEANLMARGLNDEKLVNFTGLATLFNDEEISFKRKIQSSESVRKRRSESHSINTSILENDSSDINRTLYEQE